MVNRESSEKQTPPAASVLRGGNGFLGPEWTLELAGHSTKNVSWTSSSDQWEAVQDHPILLTYLSLQDNNDSYLLLTAGRALSRQEFFWLCSPSLLFPQIPRLLTGGEPCLSNSFRMNERFRMLYYFSPGAFLGLMIIL